MITIDEIQETAGKENLIGIKIYAIDDETEEDEDEEIVEVMIDQDNVESYKSIRRCYANIYYNVEKKNFFVW